MKNLTFFIQNFRWILAGALLSFSSSYGQTFFIAIFAGHIQKEFGLSHGAWGSFYMIGTLCSAFLLLYAGGLADQFRARLLSAIALLCLALACFLMGLNHSATGLIVALFALRFFGQGMMSHIAKESMARWFVASRGKALAFSSMGFSLGEAILPIVYVSLIASLGWRSAWIAAGLVSLCVIPMMLYLLNNERTPQSIAKENAAFGMGARHWTRGQALRHWLFWLILPTVCAIPTIATALFFHQVHFASSKGWSQIEFVSLFPIYTGFTIAMTFTSGFLVDRLGVAKLLPFYTLPAAVSFLIFWQADSLFAAGAGFASFALSTGAFMTLIPAFWAEFYGTQHLGSIKSLSTVIMVTATAIGPGLTGWLIDLGIGFSQQMPAISGFFILCSISSALAMTLVSRQEMNRKNTATT